MRPSKYRRRDNKALGIPDSTESTEAYIQRKLHRHSVVKRSSVKNALREFSRRITYSYDENFLEDLIDYDMILDG